MKKLLAFFLCSLIYSFLPAQTSKVKDIYIAGSESNGAKQVAKYWKNGIATDLSDGTASTFPHAIVVAGNDVHVVAIEYGSTSPVAKYWKNGILTNLTDGTKDADANSIVVAGNDVYIAGSAYNGTKRGAILWKNGVATIINTDPSSSAKAMSLYITK
jgi:hypothetical protein